MYMTHRLSIWVTRCIGGEGSQHAKSDYLRQGLALAFLTGVMFIAQFAFGDRFFYRIGAAATCLCTIAAGCVLIFGSAWWARKVSIATSLVLTVITWATFLL